MFQNTSEPKVGKFGSSWKRPYKVTKVVKPEVYRLETLDRIPVMNSLNARYMKKIPDLKIKFEVNNLIKKLR